MRVIAGTARGIRLQAPEGKDIRPTLDRVREALFSILMPRIEDARFLDLFAGTGANGIEALSRGAASATFVDGDRKALTTVRDNLNKARVVERAMCLQLEIPRDIERISGQYDVIFADPPYGFEDFEGLLQAIAESNLLAEDGVLIVEHDRKQTLPEEAGRLEQHRLAPYGRCALAFYA